jgi:hypothetical protein
MDSPVISSTIDDRTQVGGGQGRTADGGTLQNNTKIVPLAGPVQRSAAFCQCSVPDKMVCICPRLFLRFRLPSSMQGVYR